MLYFLKWVIWGPTFLVGLCLLVSGNWAYGVALWGICWLVIYWQWKTWSR